MDGGGTRKNRPISARATPAAPIAITAHVPVRSRLANEILAVAEDSVACPRKKKAARRGYCRAAWRRTWPDRPLGARDGRGYPDGLYDREIPFIAKIVNLADSFDAMTTDRPYKARRPANDVVQDLQKNAGKQFAPELVQAFLGGMLKELTGTDRDKRFRRLLGREYMEADGIVDTLRSTLNEMAPTTPMTYVAAASSISDRQIH